MPFEDIRTLIRAGRLRDSQRALEKIDQETLSRAARLEFGFLCFEAGSPLMTVSALRPLVRPKPNSGITPLPEEIAEYARSLSLLGLTGEARDLLSLIDLKRHPRAVDSVASVLLRDWEWQTAVPILEEALANPRSLGEGQTLLLKLDLGIALAFGNEDYSRSQQLLEEILRCAGEKSFPWIRYNALMNLATVLLLQKSWKESENCISRAEQIFREQSNPRVLHLNLMRRSFLELARCTRKGNRQGIRKARLGLSKAKAFFLENGLFWFCRACDYNEGLLGLDSEPLLRLYFGTVHSAPKKRARRALDRMGVELPRDYTLEWQSSVQRNPISLELAAKPIWRSNAALPLDLKPGQLCHRLFCFFVTEIYQRPSVSELFGLIYREQHFDPDTSILRVANGLARLRKSIAKAKLPARIRVKNGKYGFEPQRPMRVRITEVTGWIWEPQFRERFEDRPFSSSEAAELMGTSARMARYQLNEAFSRGWVFRSGRGRSTRYKLGAPRNA